MYKTSRCIKVQNVSVQKPFVFCIWLFFIWDIRTENFNLNIYCYSNLLNWEYPVFVNNENLYSLAIYTMHAHNKIIIISLCLTNLEFVNVEIGQRLEAVDQFCLNYLIWASCKKVSELSNLSILQEAIRTI